MTCAVCRDPRRRQIERALWSRSTREVAARYALGRMTVHRHVQHMRERIQASRALRTEFAADRFWESGDELWTALLAAAARAKRTGEHKDVAAAHAILVQLWDKRARALGLIQAPSVHVDASQRTAHVTQLISNGSKFYQVVQALEPTYPGLVAAITHAIAPPQAVVDGP